MNTSFFEGLMEIDAGERDPDEEPGAKDGDSVSLLASRDKPISSCSSANVAEQTVNQFIKSPPPRVPLVDVTNDPSSAARTAEVAPAGTPPRLSRKDSSGPARSRPQPRPAYTIALMARAQAEAEAAETAAKEIGNLDTDSRVASPLPRSPSPPAADSDGPAPSHPQPRPAYTIALMARAQAEAEAAETAAKEIANLDTDSHVASPLPGSPSPPAADFSRAVSASDIGASGLFVDACAASPRPRSLPPSTASVSVVDLIVNDQGGRRRRTLTQFGLDHAKEIEEKKAKAERLKSKKASTSEARGTRHKAVVAAAKANGKGKKKYK